ncbi:formate dehydrogenase subunit gamma [Oecophyllibacter saccharovorans]|uniref:Formate dehydrogenase subunit gamma n=1 Tax=Oecophyllibacter saccharovorans TaxID=2558360 RepID=A0A506URX7_9PROT|nr:formate dehydrogenase subunit gamma [Oecophyllibacter saccharovorans]TPW36039.1 formate dehydrogenase subunit gamma [Oecophyllibacter saccharovorans]
MEDKYKILRCKYTDRLLHWGNATCFALAAFSGLSFFFPSLDIMGRVLGPGQLARTLHPFMGIAVFCFLFIMFFRFVRHNLPDRFDILWFKNIVGVLMNQHGKDLHIGKYNAGQKVLFWCIMSLIWVLMISGLMVWRKYFAGYFSQSVLRVAILVHSAAAISLMMLILGHIYMGIWVRGSITGMVTGFVTRRWARVHHDRWFEGIMKKEGAKARQELAEGVPPNPHAH